MSDIPTKNSPADALEPVLIEAALAGGRAVLAVYDSDFTVRTKEDDTPVCEADEAGEAAILAVLSESCPGVPIVAEESASANKLPATGRRFFLVDPLDGTKEFIRRNGEFTVNIGLIEDGVPVAGIVLAPALGKVFVAAGGKAWLGSTDAECNEITYDRSLKVRASSDAPTAVASRSHANEATLAMLEKVAADEKRSIGSSLKFCIVAEADADFYPRLGPTMEWDTAAGDAVLRTSGGTVVTVDGAPLVYGKADVEGMRPFENPFFLATGDARLLERVGIRRDA